MITAVFGALAASFLMTLKTVNSGKVRTAASALVNEQMEVLRNLPYDSLATQNGTIFPQGAISDTQTITRSGVSYTLTTEIVTVDDPFDGCVIPAGQNLYSCTDGGTSSQQDLVPVDYKRISIEATQVGSTVSLAKASSNAAAKAAETPTNTGILLVIVNDSQGQPVVDATVTVTNVPANVSLQGTTNNRGYFFVANLPPDHQNGYHIIATKTGYSQDGTTSRTSQNPNQVQPDVDISVQQITTQTLAIDLLSTMAVSVVNEANQPLPNVILNATGTKLTSTNPDTPKNTFTQITNSSGLATFPNIEWDSYALTPPGNYYVVTTSPYQTVALNPNTTLNVTLVLTTDNHWPLITDVSPNSGTTGAAVDVTIDGDNFESDTTVLLRKSGSSDVVPTQINVAANKKSLTAHFDLTGVAAGAWDIVLTSSGKTATQIQGFVIS